MALCAMRFVEWWLPADSDLNGLKGLNRLYGLHKSVRLFDGSAVPRFIKVYL